MRIWIIHQHAIPPNVMGPTRHYDLAKALIEQGHEVFIFAGNYCHNSFLYIAEPYCRTKKIVYYTQVPFIWFKVPAYKKNSIARVWNMLMFAVNLLRCKDLSNIPPPDVIIGSSPSPFAAFAASQIAKRYQVPFVYEIRDLWPKTLLHLGNFRKSHPLIAVFQFIENKLLKESMKIISVLPGVKKYLNEKNIDPAKLSWLPNATNVKQIAYQFPETRSHVTEIVYAGSFNLSNDVTTLLQAAKILHSQNEETFQFTLIGDGPLKKDLIAYVNMHGLSNVNIMPTVSKDTIYLHLAKADILVGMVKKSGLYQYGTSLNKITDYLAIARPIIFALDSPYSPITEAKAGMTIEPENPELLAKAIIQIAALPIEERNQLGKNARQYAEENFDIDIIAQRLISHLLELSPA